MKKEEIEKMVKEYEKQGYLNLETLSEALERWSRQYRDRTALVDAKRRVTYGQLNENVRRLAGRFRREGLQKNDNVLVQIPNSISFMEICFALFFLGVRPVLMLPAHGERELESVAELARPVAIITVPEDLGTDYGKRALEISQKKSYIQKLFLTESREYGISVYETEDIELEELPEKPEPWDIALFLLSGGTTGTPKLIPKIHAAYLYNAAASAERCGVTGNSVYLAALSIAHDYPLCCPGMIGTLCKGGKCVISATAEADEALSWIEKERVTFTSIVPVVAAMWEEEREWNPSMDLSSLQYLLIGAAKLDRELAEKLERNFSCKILQGYGLGEGITCFTSPDDKKEVAWETQGRPISAADVIKIVDETGREVENGVSGELTEKGPYTFLGYYRAPDLNRQIFTKDGFFKTGDKAMLNADGNVVILGRVREQINRAGENIIPEEIEAFIKEWNEVKEAAVIGIPDQTLGERTCAVVVTRKRSITLAELCRFLLKQGIAAFKLPDQLVLLEGLPYINVGKVDKKKLKLLAAERGEQYAE